MSAVQPLRPPTGRRTSSGAQASSGTLPAVLLSAFALSGCAAGAAQVVDGPSPLAELAVLGSIRTQAQPSPGAEVTGHNMRVHEAPDEPPRLPADEVPMVDDELVVGLVVDGHPVAYPMRFLNLVEVVNDRVSDTPVVISWCPLAGTAATFHRRVGDETRTFHFGTSLIHDSLLLVDEESGSVWAQVPRRAISGPLRDEHLTVIPSIQTTWGFWRSQHPDTEVMVFPSEEGLPYHYADFEADHFPNPPPEVHDPSTLGVGIVQGDDSWFFPFRELELAQPEEITFADGALRVRYEAEGMTAWVEDEDGRMVDSQVAYERAWLAFYPDSRIYRESSRDHFPSPGL